MTGFDRFYQAKQMMNDFTEDRIELASALDHRSDFEKYSLARDYSVDWNDPFGPDLIMEFRIIHQGPLITSDNLKYNVPIRLPNHFE